MSDISNWSDEQLRSKLLEYGFPIMPITGTTRKVMVKKLKLLVENQNKQPDRRSLAEFSSEDEVEGGEHAKNKKKGGDKNRRATMAVVQPMQPPKSAKSSQVTPDDVKGGRKIQKKIEKKATTRSERIISMIQEPETNSDSEPEINESFGGEHNTSSPKQGGMTPLKKAGSYSVSATGAGHSSYYSPGGRYSSYTNYPLGGTTSSADSLNQIRSRLSLGNSRFTHLTSNNDDQDQGSNSEHTPYLSGFTKKLSELSQNNRQIDGSERESSLSFKSGELKEHDANNGLKFSRSLFMRPKIKEYARGYQNAGNVGASKVVNNGGGGGSNYVPFVLVGLAALFFLTLAALYWGMHSGTNSNELIGLEVPRCLNNGGGDDDSKCLREADVPSAADIYTILKPQLIKLAINQRCNDVGAKFYMTDRDIVDHIRANYKEQEESVILRDVDKFVILAYKNPFWEISVLQVSIEMETFTYEDRTATLDMYLERQASSSKRAFAVLTPTLPFKCAALLKFASTLKAAVVIIAISTLLWLTRFTYNHIKQWQQRESDEIINMVETIIDLLQSNVSNDDPENNFLVINHVRDMILTVKNRKKMEGIWSKAVEYIGENDSRVRTEVQLVHGEPYEVWRWVGGGISTNSNSTTKSNNKSWQGQAFETQAGSVNSLPCSPTSCLKIRGMVDEGDRNLHAVREAVFSKCTSQCRILHCAVDVKSKCVYLKCADQNDAAVAYKNLHGWWYASHLVTVKYLRLERYMQRFPDSPQSGPPFLKSHIASN